MSKDIDWIQGDKFISLMSENIAFCKTEYVNYFFEYNSKYNGAAYEI